MSSTELLTGFLNVTILVGSCLVKLPQLVRIVRSRSVRGLSEASFALQALGYSVACCYAILLGYPFGAWGESGIITVQALGIMVAFWLFGTGIDVCLRCLAAGAWIVVCLSFISCGNRLPDFFVTMVGVSPGIIFFVARVPQILMNHRQCHTGELSAATHALQLAGGLVRIFTTFAQLSGDLVVLLGHASAAFLNAILLWQMYRYRRVTRAINARK